MFSLSPVRCFDSWLSIILEKKRNNKRNYSESHLSFFFIQVFVYDGCSTPSFLVFYFIVHLYVWLVLHILLIAVLNLSYVRVCVCDCPVHIISYMFIIHSRFSSFSFLFKNLLFYFCLLFKFCCLSKFASVSFNLAKTKNKRKCSFFRNSIEKNTNKWIKFLWTQTLFFLLGIFERKHVKF